MIINFQTWSPFPEPVSIPSGSDAKSSTGVNIPIMKVRSITFIPATAVPISIIRYHFNAFDGLCLGRQVMDSWRPLHYPGTMMAAGTTMWVAEFALHILSGFYQRAMVVSEIKEPRLSPKRPPTTIATIKVLFRPFLTNPTATVGRQWFPRWFRWTKEMQNRQQ